MVPVGARIDEFEAADARVLGVAVRELPAERARAQQEATPYPLLGDTDTHMAGKYGVLRDYKHWKYSAYRTVYVIARGGQIIYRWQGEDQGDLPDVDEVLDAAHTAR